MEATYNPSSISAQFPVSSSPTDLILRYIAQGLPSRMPQPSHHADQANHEEIDFYGENGHGAYEELPFHDALQRTHRLSENLCFDTRLMPISSNLCAPVTQSLDEFLAPANDHHGPSGHGPHHLDGHQPGSSSTYATPSVQSGPYSRFSQPDPSFQPLSLPPDCHHHLAPANSSNTGRTEQSRSRLRSPRNSSAAVPSIRPILPYPPTNAIPRRSQAAPSRVPHKPIYSPGQCSSDAHASLLTLSSPVPPKALLPVDAALVHNPHTLCKFTLEDNQTLTKYFKSQLWLSRSKKEPDIKPDDELIKAGLIKQTSKSRLYALISVDGSGDSVCRLRHAIEKGGHQIECTEKFKKGKDALAHVCVYFDYKAYKCQGRPEHPKCGKVFLTNERRNDHFSKAKKPKETGIPCSTCKTPICRRNHPRHHLMCESKAPIPTELIDTPSGRQSLPKCGCA